MYSAPHYGLPAQLTEPHDSSATLPPSGLLHVQRVIGVLLYYARAVDNTLLVAIGSLSSAQSAPTEATLEAITHLLNYCATHPDAVIHYTASAMALHVHSDASYLSVTNARSRIGGYFCLTNRLSDPIRAPSPDSPPLALNGPIHVNSTILKMVVASAAEAELGALFYNAKDAAMLRTTLEEMGHPQVATPI